jgi:ankyrin repeat protein
MRFLGKLLSLLRSPSAGSTSIPAKEVTKKDIKTLFASIRAADLNVVRGLIEANKNLVNTCAFAPPKKDDGQSPLQVSLKTGQFAIADYLIENGANVNFMEQSKTNEWTTPVLHDAIRAAAFNAEVGRFHEALRILKKLLQRGADPNAVDSYGNNCLMRVILDARIRIPAGCESAATSYLLADLGEIFKALIEAGADIHAKQGDRPSAFEDTRGSILERFIG